MSNWIKEKTDEPTAMIIVDGVQVLFATGWVVDDLITLRAVLGRFNIPVKQSAALHRVWRKGTGKLVSEARCGFCKAI